MKILVTGATGGLGRNAVEFLQSRGVDVLATGRNRAIGEVLRAQGVEFVECDLSGSPEVLISLFKERGVDVVWHCAALSSPWGAYEAFVDANLVATERLVLAAAAFGVKCFVHVSTPSLYFDYSHRRNIPETFVPRKYVNAYAETKALAEQKIQQVTRDFPAMRTALIRPRGIFGKYDQALVPRIERVLNERGRVPLPNGGKALVDLTHVDNVVHAMWLATVQEDVPSGTTFNITNGEPTTVADVLERLFRSELKRDFAIAAVPYWVLDTAARALEAIASRNGKEPLLTRYSAGALAFDMTLDITRAKALLGYTPIVSMAEGIAKTAAWMRTRD
jgi:nucleoside-diphosphate-sugar epimerase